MAYDPGFTYHSLTFAVEELEGFVAKAKEAGEEYVDLTFTWDDREVQDLIEACTDELRIELADDIIAKLGWESDQLDNLRVGGFEAYWEKIDDTAKRGFLEEQLSKVIGARTFCVEHLARLNPASAADTDELKRLVEDCGFGHLLKGEDR